ncbi:MAG: hypothetical protein LUG13_04430 [Oscillospiraceae bacterium]|nr:hypothetical protein [Oscillospiraceae bacterium]
MNRSADRLLRRCSPALMWVCLALLVGSVGAMDCHSVGLLQGAMQAAACLVGMVFFGHRGGVIC